MHILLVTDADWVVNEVTAALGGPETSFTVCREGRLVSKLVASHEPDVVITDLQVGSMGGMAISIALHNDHSVGVLPHVPVIMLLDRPADVYLAQRSQAGSWLIKPLDSLRLKRAVAAATSGQTYQEGVPAAPVTDEVAESTEEESVDAG